MGNFAEPRVDTGREQAKSNSRVAISAAATLTRGQLNIEVVTPASSNYDITLPHPAECEGETFIAWSRNAGGGTATIKQLGPLSSTTYVLKGANDYVVLKSNRHAWLELGKVITP